MREHLRHHRRFYEAALLGVLALALAWTYAPRTWWSVVISGDAFFAAYLVLVSFISARSTPPEMRARASYEDEGVAAIWCLTAIAVGLCLVAIFNLLGDRKEASDVALAAASVPLAWLTVHTVMAFHYAHVYYTPAEASDGRDDSGGLAFPGTSEPHMWDFLYFSLVLGMTFQVSDVETLSTRMRRTTLFHGVISFFFNTVILALAVNIAVNVTGKG